jgi:diguanylate cyclase (GGDEF)-like protein
MKINRPKPRLEFPRNMTSSIPPGTALGLAVENVLLRRSSLTDPLTGLCNRLAYESSYVRMLSGAVRNGRALTVAIVDVDGFKKLNDRFGHKTGDAVLKAIAGVLKKAVRTNDFVARWGGDEFVVLLDEAGPLTARVPLERIRKEIGGLTIKVNRRSPKVTVSIGFATFTPGSVPPRFSEKAWAELSVRVFEQADKALYQAKNSGRNRVVSSA